MTAGRDFYEQIFLRAECVRKLQFITQKQEDSESSMYFHGAFAYCHGFLRM